MIHCYGINAAILCIISNENTRHAISVPSHHVGRETDIFDLFRIMVSITPHWGDPPASPFGPGRIRGSCGVEARRLAEGDTGRRRMIGGDGSDGPAHACM